MTRRVLIPSHLTNRAGIASLASLVEVTVEARMMRERFAEHGPDRLAELTAELVTQNDSTNPDPARLRALLLELTAAAVLELTAVDEVLAEAAAGAAPTPRLAAVAHG